MKVSVSYQGIVRTKLDHKACEFAKDLDMIETDRFFDVQKGIRVIVFEATKKTLEKLEEK